MSNDDSTANEGKTAPSPDYGQLAFVALAALALIAAAFVAPPMAGEGAGGSGSSGDGGTVGTPEGGEGDGDAPVNLRKLLEWLNLLDRGDGGGEREVVVPAEQCRIDVAEDPVPGATVTVRVLRDRQPVPGVTVWFDDRRIGETDRDGTVVGTVPYTEELTVSVDLENCGSIEAPTASLSAAGVAGGDTARTAGGAEETAGVTAWAATTAHLAPRAFGSSETSFDAQTDDAGANESVDVAVEGAVGIELLERPLPGETVPVVATVEGVPMREAAVSVDGDRVGRTDEDGRIDVSIPDDGTERFDLRVSRGDFSGTETVSVHLLEATLRPAGLAPVPGSDGVVVATMGGENVTDATVTIEGERRGTTDENGTLAVTFPVDPTATVTVTAMGQTATTSLASVYAAPVGLFAIVVAGLCALSYRRYGARGPAAVLGAVSWLAAFLVAEAFYGTAGALAVLAATSAAAILVAARRNRDDLEAAGRRASTAGRRAADAGRSLPELLARLLERLRAGTLRLVDALERALDRALTLAARLRIWLRSLPRSGRGLLGRALEWFGTLVGRTVSRVRRAPVRALLAAGVGVAALAGGYALRGAGGAVAVLAIGALVVLAAARLRSARTGASSEEPGDSAPETPRTGVGSGDPTDANAERATFREIWRAFARRVRPRRWRTSSPGEVSRAAVDEGYPREAVRELTALFREVEYGGRTLSSDVRRRADDAYRTVVDASAGATGDDGERTRDERERDERERGEWERDEPEGNP